MYYPADVKAANVLPTRKCVSMGAAGAQICRSFGHHLLHLHILRLLVLLKPADFEAQLSSIEKTAPAIQISNPFPANVFREKTRS